MERIMDEGISAGLAQFLQMRARPTKGLGVKTLKTQNGGGDPHSPAYPNPSHGSHLPSYTAVIWLHDLWLKAESDGPAQVGLQ